MDAIETGQLVAGHYRLVERIGSGGAGVVWRAVDERLERSVAVKQIPIQPSLPDSEREMIRQRAIREARNAARFHHPNAIVVYDITEHEGHPCLVMEYFESRSLAEVLKAHTALPLAQAVSMGEQVSGALIAAHDAGIVHRDIKPGNILLDDFGTAKITDFGISRAVGDINLTATGLVSGTAAYLPPEVAQGADPTPASDVFSLGATLLHAVDGEPPYGNNQNSLALLYAAANGQVREPRHAGAATDLLRHLLSVNPGDRPSMSQAHAVLGRLTDSGVSAAATTALPANAGRRRTAHSRPLHSPPPPPPSRPMTRGAAAFAPASGPSSAHHAQNSRKPVVYAGSAAVVVLALLALVIVVTNLPSPGDTDTETGVPGVSDTIVADAGQTANSGSQVDWGQGGQLVQQFYSNPAGSWSLLTPAAQDVFGSQQSFQDYWSERVIQSFGQIEAIKRANNDDGSVDMQVNNLTYDGQTKQVTVRVVDVGGRLLIDGDPR
ncbi:serine/threonine-protein kinase [Hoyosella subflava]|uniref:non-specific serine/threonine protein kinase n=1 Tax=Hoyosella subflava (strain DSM 45089 / JCM 17490 / NBRC 109087 / DQS3-9A1) TaxID=443218 RepID=F6EEI6_HOYSD|nr:serine/threonine-protein kinase [Hoyosella subflava]AEF39683.1 Putative serine/threonine protein kinase [Hoyosella subflava DQS3-9A1]